MQQQQQQQQGYPAPPYPQQGQVVQGQYGNVAPMAPPAPVAGPSQMQFNDGGAREFLHMQHWPAGLQETFIKNVARVPIRYFILDDSGSMAMSDGHRVNTNANGSKSIISSTRWAELGQAMEFHIQLAKQAAIPTEFRLLNAAPPILVGANDPNEGPGISTLQAVFSDSPNGGTPLCRHINEIVAKISSMEQYLRSTGQLACVNIFTDGQSSDGNVAQAMKPLKNLPVHVVVRLCTDQDDVVEYWNKVDGELELRMDVLDDLIGEAKEVNEHNKFFTYGEPVHRLREFGITVKEFDLLDEQRLSLDQVRKVCSEIFGTDVNKMPSPEADWEAFVHAVEAENKRVGKVWCPRRCVMADWINVKDLAKAFGKGGCVIM